LLRTALAELEASGEYDFVVLQATAGAVDFYARMGFQKVEARADHYKTCDVAADSSAESSGQAEFSGWKEYRHFSYTADIEPSYMMALR
jgi:hypothetical protein